MGINKTAEKILRCFYWPDLRKSVAGFVQSCDTCQRGGKPNQKVPRAPLQPIPVVGEPFHKIIVDCVGPMPKTKKGHQYLLTIMCTTTRYPEAIPLRNLRSQGIVKALLSVFTKYGIPQIGQSDIGTNFTADLFSEVMRGLGVTQYLASAYHPESQGALERFHQTFKTLLKMYCLENESDWDEGLDLLLFAIRDAKNSSLEFSPFQLLFGREVRGPLKVLKDTWVNDDVTYRSPCTYFNQFRNKLTRIHNLATENLAKSQKVMEDHYNIKSVKRSFNPGDLVLVYLPNQRDSLKAKFDGPYKILEKVSDVNYIIHTPNRRKSTKLIHINLIKPYHSKLKENFLLDDKNEKAVMSFSSNVRDDVTVNPSAFTIDTLENSTYMSNLETNLCDLSVSQKGDISNLFSFPNVCSDRPGICKLMEHGIQLVDGTTPIKQAPYRVTPQKRKRLKAAVQYLLDMDLAEPSDSPWASPCILVPKSDNTDRLCTDYRRLNKVTVPDAYPLPRLDDLVDTIGTARFVSKIDLLRGYYQIPLTKEAMLISAFATPDGLYQYRFMPFGLCNAPATFQRIINRVIHGLPGVKAYLDDLLVVSDDWETHKQRMWQLFERLQDAGLVIRLSKCQFGGAEVEYLGHIIGQGRTAPRSSKLESISQYPVPQNRKALRRFLGMAGFYRKFCKNFAIISPPLTKLCSSKQEFKSTQEAQESFDQIKGLLMSAPVLKNADFNQPFTIQVDACDIGAGAVLLQKGTDPDILHPICYFSSKFLPHQRSYSTIEKECLALLLALRKFNFFIYDSMHRVEVHCDHNPIKFIDKMQNTNQRLMRWSLELQDYNINISHIRGRDNIIADTLSRCYL